ncbi:hypothetical protein ACFYUJ_33620 [Streptomyces sp. NPDC004520]|uniref:hypothetical protein n=1 Tax=Streptomyces sp. NPDC004520 TaxID=3364702 RepID=UPI00367E09E7
MITINNGLPLRTLAEAVPGPVAKLVPSVGNTAAALAAAGDDLTEAWRAAFQATADNERSKPAPQLGAGRV